MERSKLFAANDNCFWRWLLGPYPPFDTASELRRRIRKLRSPSSRYFLADKADLIAENQLFLDLIEAVVMDHDIEKAKALAPALNRVIPDLMMRCPDASLRPGEN